MLHLDFTDPAGRLKRFRHSSAGPLTLHSTSLLMADDPIIRTADLHLGTGQAAKLERLDVTGTTANRACRSARGQRAWSQAPMRSMAWPDSGSKPANACQTCGISSQTSSVTSTPASRAFAANRVESSRITSASPTWIRIGGSPCRSAYSGEAYGCRGSAPARYVAASLAHPVRLDHHIDVRAGGQRLTGERQVRPGRHRDRRRGQRIASVAQRHQRGEGQAPAGRIARDRDGRWGRRRRSAGTDRRSARRPRRRETGARAPAGSRR